MKLFQVVYSVANNKCPRCHQGEVFEHKNPYRLGAMFKMYKTCSHCELKYEKEPSFFYGAMYASYALTSGWFILWYFLDKYLLHWNIMTFAIFISATVILLSPVSIRWSRLLWLNLFNTYNKSYKNNTINK